jgi:hypothetical protein
MVQAIKQVVTVEEGGVVRLRSDQLSPGTRVELIVLVDQAAPAEASSPPGDWKMFIGSINSGDPHAGDNDRIDRDLAREYAAEDHAG